jgi:hypothetical protein
LPTEVLVNPGTHFRGPGSHRIVGRLDRVELRHDHPKGARADFIEQSRLAPALVRPCRPRFDPPDTVKAIPCNGVVVRYHAVVWMGTIDCFRYPRMPCSHEVCSDAAWPYLTGVELPAGLNQLSLGGFVDP